MRTALFVAVNEYMPTTNLERPLTGKVTASCSANLWRSSSMD